jgi:hypothetical protein
MKEFPVMYRIFDLLANDRVPFCCQFAGQWESSSSEYLISWLMRWFLIRMFALLANEKVGSLLGGLREGFMLESRICWPISERLLECHWESECFLLECTIYWPMRKFLVRMYDLLVHKRVLYYNVWFAGQWEFFVRAFDLLAYEKYNSLLEYMICWPMRVPY